MRIIVPSILSIIHNLHLFHRFTKISGAKQHTIYSIVNTSKHRHEKNMVNIFQKDMIQGKISCHQK